MNYPTPALAAFIEKLHSQGQHYMVILDPAIHNRTGYPTYDSGLEQDVFIKQASGEVFIGQVWPGYTAFPSFYAANTQNWWTQNINTWRQAVPVDGLWIDMSQQHTNTRVERDAKRRFCSRPSVRSNRVLCDLFSFFGLSCVFHR